MRIVFEFEDKIDTENGKKENKFSLSDIKEKAKKVAKVAATKSNEAAIKFVTNASEASEEILCKIADIAQATVYAIDEYFADSLKNEKTFSEKLSEFETEEKLTIDDLLDSLDVYRKEESVEDTVIAFFENIEYPETEISYDAFASVVSMDKITYDAVAETISETYVCISEEEIISELIGDFNEWLETHPKVSEICAKPNLRYLMMYFARKAKETKSEE